MTFKKVSQDQNSITYADDANRSFTVRVKSQTGVKRATCGNLLNAATEIIINKNRQIGDSCENEVLSVRLRVSGSVDAGEDITQMVGLIGSFAATLDTEGAFQGYFPEAVPSL